MDLEKYNAIREAAKKRKEERERMITEETSDENELVQFESVDALMEAIRKES